jgi:CofD-related protein of GAK system
MRIAITRETDIPDPLRLARYERAPELGPRILFFSGGSALRGTCRELVRYTHNSIHIITPFDSGGSSAIIRKAFAMPAVGDIRNRLMSLADQSLKGNPEIFDLFAHRLEKDQSRKELRESLDKLATGRHPLIRRAPDPMRKILRNHFIQFRDAMPETFDLRGASLGNLVLAAGYLANRRQLDPVIYLFSKLVEVRGVVRPAVNKNLHLAVELADGTVIVGQHKITGKESAPLASPIGRIWLAASLDDPEPVDVSIRDKIRKRVAEAELICFPVGSFYSSVLANLLPAGMGRAVAANSCPKVFVPNTSADPEAIGLDVAGQVARLLELLRRDASDALAAPDGRLLNFVLVDSKNAQYPGGLNLKAIRSLGPGVVDCRLVSPESFPLIDSGLLAKALVSFV